MISAWRALVETRVPIQLFRFALVGVAATATHYFVAAGLAATDPYAANLGGYLAAVGLSYHGHKHWTFRERRPSGEAGGQWPRFVAVSLSALGLSELVLHFGLAILMLPRPLALLFAVLTVPPVTFAAARIWVFRPGN